MPLYQYQCEQCGQTREVFRQVATRDLAPPCHRRRMQRVFTPVALINPPTGAQLRADFRRFTEASADLADAGVDTTPLIRTARSQAAQATADGVSERLDT